MKNSLMQSSTLPRCRRNLVLLFLRYKTLCKTRKNAREFYLYCWDHVCKVNEWYLIDCFHREFRVSTQIMVHIYCIARFKEFYTPERVLMAFRAIFLWFRNCTLIWILLLVRSDMTKFYPWNTKNTDRNDVSKQETHTRNAQRKITLERAS